jgi:uncharacterized protein (DUF2336 family)
MTVANSLLPELDEIIRHGDPERRAHAARRITDFFVQGAANFRSDHVELFDGVLISLVPDTEVAARVDLAERLSFVPNAPPALVGQLAREDEIMIAGPLLRRSLVIEEPVLIEIARSKSQGHLLAMSERSTLSPHLTDVMVRRGDREVVRRTAENPGAAFSPSGYSMLIKRAVQDGILTLKVGQREDLSDEHLKELLAGSIDPVRRHLFQVLKPARQAAIKQAVAAMSGLPGALESRRDFTDAQRTILALHRDGYLNEGALLGFAKAHQYDEAVATLSAMSAVPLETLDRLISGDRHDPVLIIGKKMGLEWATVRALLLLRLGPDRTPPPADIESWRANFMRLMPSTAERIVRFWKTRQAV